MRLIIALGIALAAAMAATAQSQNRVGPSFNCSAARVANQPLAQIICSNQQLSLVDLAYVIAYHAARHSYSAAHQQLLLDEAVGFLSTVQSHCGIPTAGWLGRAATGAEIACVGLLYEAQRRKIISRLAGPALQEALLAPGDAILTQQLLRGLGYLPAESKIDGLFGPATRSAIAAFQRASGATVTEFGSQETLRQLAIAFCHGGGVNRCADPPPPTAALPRTLVQLRVVGGTFTVPVTINGVLALNFVLDSGAADVLMPADVVATLVRTGTLTESDLLGEKTYVTADGSKMPSRTFRIRSLKVGDRTIENVTGSVGPVQGSLLLGMSFLRRFKSWSIDNNTHQLILE